jgi:hypothetical protein
MHATIIGNLLVTLPARSLCQQSLTLNHHASSPFAQAVLPLAAEPPAPRRVIPVPRRCRGSSNNQGDLWIEEYCSGCSGFFRSYVCWRCCGIDPKEYGHEHKLPDQWDY